MVGISGNFTAPVCMWGIPRVSQVIPCRVTSYSLQKQRQLYSLPWVTRRGKKPCLKLVGRRVLSVSFLSCHLFFLSFLSLNSILLPQTMAQAYPLTLLVTAKVKEISSLCPRKALVSCFYALQGAEQTLLTVPSVEKQSCFSVESGTVRTFIPVGLFRKQLCRRSVCRAKGEQVRAHDNRIWQTCPIQASYTPVALFQHLR